MSKKDKETEKPQEAPSPWGWAWEKVPGRLRPAVLLVALALLITAFVTGIFKDLADLRKEIFDEDVEAIIMDEIIKIPEVFELVSLGVMSGSMKLPTAAVRMKIDGADKEGAAIGVGPIDATYRAIAKLTGTSSKLLFFSVSSITGGTDAQGDVLVRIEDDGRVVIGYGLDPDIITAAAKAYLNGLNRLVYLKKESVNSEK